MANFVSGVIAIVLAVVMIGSVLLPVVKAQNTTGWSTSELAVWGLVSLISIIGLVYGITQVFGIA